MDEKSIVAGVEHMGVEMEGREEVAQRDGTTLEAMDKSDSYCILPGMVLKADG